MSGFQLDNLRKGQKYLVIKFFCETFFVVVKERILQKVLFHWFFKGFCYFCELGKSLLLVFLNIMLDNIPIF